MAGLATRAAMPPMRGVSRRLLDALSIEAADHAPSLLEVGCGSGALTIALLERGATTASGIDLSPASVEMAHQRAAAAGMSERTRFEVGDGASVLLVPHDWVVLDRVLCCYADLDRLLRNSMVAARRRFAFSVPMSSGWRGLVNRLIVSIENATNALRSRPCPGFVHDVRHIEARLGAAGFRRTRNGRQGLWYVAVFDRI
jgi:SAM-dependent methyltransferase